MRFFSVLTALILVGGASAAAAQDVAYGVKAGVNFATLSYDPDAEADLGTRVGLVVGGFVSMPLGARLSLQPEVLFSQKGQTAEGMGVTAKIKLDYLEVPVLVTYALSRSAGRGFYILAGPSIAFKLSAEASATFGDQEVDDDDIGDEIEDFDFGVVFGAGMDFGRLTVDGRYTLGFTNLSIDTEDAAKVKNRAISILAGIRF